MIRWILAQFDHRSKAELLDQVAAQQELIRHLLGKPVMQLAKLAYNMWLCLETDGRDGYVTPGDATRKFMLDNAPALQCLKGDDEA